MKTLTHAFLSIVRKPSKAILLFVILLVIFSLVFTGIIIQNSILRSKEAIRRGLGAIVSLEPDYMKAMKDKLPQEDYPRKLSLTASLADDLAKDPSVARTHVTEVATGISSELKSAISPGEGVISLEGNGSDNSTYLPMYGSNQLIPLPFSSGKLTLAQGRHRTEADAGRHVVLVSEEFAAKNKLALGQQISVKSADGTVVQSCEIIGLYAGADTYGTDMMYTAPESCRSLTPGQSEPQIVSIHFELDDPLQVDGFLQRNKERLPSEYLRLNAGNSEYTRLTRPLDLMSTITTLMLWVVFLAGALILIAIVTLFIRDRRFEIGLLLSNGTPKLGIMAQFVLELLLVACLAFGVSAVTSRLTSGATADWIAQTQLVEDESTDGMEAVMAFGGELDYTGSVKMEDVARQFDVSIDAKTMTRLTLISLGLLLAAAAAPLSVILAFKPRESLQG